MFSLLKKYELRGAKRRVRLFNRFQIESVLKIAPYHTLKFGGIGKLAYLCIVVRRKAALDKLPFSFLPLIEIKPQNAAIGLLTH